MAAAPTVKQTLPQELAPSGARTPHRSPRSAVSSFFHPPLNEAVARFDRATEFNCRAPF